MTISSETTRSGPYSGNGSTTAFNYGFKVTDQSHLEVVLKVTSTGVETVKSISTHYTVSGVGDDAGGQVTMGTPPASGETLTIRRKQQFLQPTDLTNQGGYVGETHETVFDKLTQMIQQVNEVIARTVTAPLSDASPTVELPAASVRANTYLTFDASGHVSTTAGAAADATAAAASATAAAASATEAAAEASAIAQKFTWSSTTSMADPGTGAMRFNHATLASVTAIALDDTSADTGNPDISEWILTFDDSTSTIKGKLQIVKVSTPATFAIFNVTALTDNSGWTQLTVAHVDSNGTFSNSDAVRMGFTRTGDKGETGSQGVQGVQGVQGNPGADGEVSEATCVALAIALG